MTTQEQEQEHLFPYYRSSSAIRSEVFSHRMRGLDESEVREFLDLLADQVQSADTERAEIRAESERLRAENERLRQETPDAEVPDITPQAVAMFSQAQQVADQLVEEAVRHARELMTSARAQQREILQHAHQEAEKAAREAEVAQAGRGAGVAASSVQAERTGTIVPMMPVAEVEYVRTFARVAQVQLRSVLDALAEQVDKLGDVTPGAPDVRQSRQQPQVSQTDAMSIAAWRTWQIDPRSANQPDAGQR